MRQNGLGRIEPKDWDHVSAMPYKAAIPFTVEKRLIVPQWYSKHNQGTTSSCVGHGNSLMMAMENEYQCRRKGDTNPYIRYNPYWLWERSKEVDEFADTAPGDNNGTTAHAAAKVMMETGHVVWKDQDNRASVDDPPELDYGISEVRWATTVDDIRAAISHVHPVNVAFTWYKKFDTPQFINGEYWMAREGDDLGIVEGGHDTCFVGASDERQAFLDANSWGPDYPLTFVPYSIVDRFIREGGEFSLITNR